MTNIVKQIDKSTYVYSGYGIVFDGAGSWSFSCDFARDIVIFGVDSSSLSHCYNCKYNFLVLGEGPIDDINGTVGAIEKKFYY